MDISFTVDATSFLTAIGISEPLKQLGLIVSDEIKLWRLKNIIYISERAKLFCQAKNIDPKKIPKSFLIPLLEAAQDQDNIILQDMWAALLGNSAVEAAVHPSYINIIKELTSVEAKVLFSFYEYSKSNNTRFMNRQTYETMLNKILGNFASLNKFLELNKQIIHNNLQRLSLIIFTKQRSGMLNLRSKNKAQITSYAISFINTCTLTI